MAADLSTFNIDTGIFTNNPRKRVSVTYQNALLRKIEDDIDAAQSAGGGAGAWGGITGDITAQLDLQNSFNLKQAAHARLDAITALDTNGILAKTNTNTYNARTITAGSAKISITNGAGTAGNPTVDLGSVALNDLSDGSTAYRSGGTDVAVADGGTGSSTAAGARTNLGLGTIAILDETTAAQYQANTADKALSTDQVWSAADPVTLNDSGGNIAVDLSTGINFKMTMDGDYTLSNPSNGKAGQCGCIELTQDGTGTQTLAYGSNWLFAGGTDPTLSTAASSKDLLFYQVLSGGTLVFANLVKAIA